MTKAEELGIEVLLTLLILGLIVEYCTNELSGKNNNSLESNNIATVSDAIATVSDDELVDKLLEDYIEKHDNLEEELIDKLLEDYIEKRDTLEEEIESLSAPQKDYKNDETEAEDLIVIETSNVDNESNNITTVSDYGLDNKLLEDYIEKRDTLEKESIDKFLEDYSEKRDNLEKEIESLLEQKKRLQDDKTFKVENLVVIESSCVNNEPNLYIIYMDDNPIDGSPIYEYRGLFKVHLHEDELHSDYYANSIPYDEFDHKFKTLFSYLNDEEIEKLFGDNGWNFTALELDEILARIRKEYQEQRSQEGYSRSLLNN